MAVKTASLPEVAKVMSGWNTTHTFTTLMQKVKALYDHSCWLRTQHWKCRYQLHSSPAPVHVWQQTKHRLSSPNICRYVMYKKLFSRLTFSQSFIPDWTRSPEGQLLEIIGTDFFTNQMPFLLPNQQTNDWRELQTLIPKQGKSLTSVILSLSTNHLLRQGMPYPLHLLSNAL